MKNPEDLFGILGSLGGVNPDLVMKEMLSRLEMSILEDLHTQIGKMIAKLQYRDSSMNPFTILGVSSDATEEQVKSAYRAKANQCHPDKGGNQSEFIQVQAAYEAIKQYKGWS